MTVPAGAPGQSPSQSPGQSPGKPLAVTMGDPAGIGGEITLRAWLGRDAATPPFLALDDIPRLRRLARDAGLAVPVAPVSSPEEALGVFADALPVFPVACPRRSDPGRPDPENAPAVVASIRRAVRMAQDRRVAGIVTNPVSKAVLYAAGFAHPGHTEFLGDMLGVRRPVMMLACPGLRVVPVTVHVGLARAIGQLTADGIAAVARVAAAALRDDFGIPAPRLAVAALNPHAGENGAMGTEEGAIVIPAIAALRAEGHDVSGPWPPDSMFTPAARSAYDAAICLYHDQALIPLKTLDQAHGVNVTLGLPVVRTSPDHGTAFDIAPHFRADPASLAAALAQAAAIARRRDAAGAGA